MGKTTITVSELDSKNITQLEQSLKVIDDKLKDEKVKNDELLCRKLQTMKNKITAQAIKTKMYYEKNKLKYPEIARSNRSFISLLRMKQITAKGNVEFVGNGKDGLGGYNAFFDTMKDFRGFAIGLGSTIATLSAVDFAITGISKQKYSLLGINSSKSALTSVISKMFGFNPAATVALFSVVGIAGAWFVVNKFLKAREQSQMHKQAIDELKMNMAFEEDEKESKSKAEEGKKFGTSYREKKAELIAELKKNPGFSEELADKLKNDPRLTPTMRRNIVDLLKSFQREEMIDELAEDKNIGILAEAVAKEKELEADKETLAECRTLISSAPAPVADSATLDAAKNDYDTAKTAYDAAEAAAQTAYNKFKAKKDYDELVSKAIIPLSAEAAKKEKLETDYPGIAGWDVDDLKTDAEKRRAVADKKKEEANKKKRIFDALKTGTKDTKAVADAKKRIAELAAKYGVDAESLEDTLNRQIAANETQESKARGDAKAKYTASINEQYGVGTPANEEARAELHYEINRTVEKIIEEAKKEADKSAEKGE